MQLRSSQVDKGKSNSWNWRKEKENIWFDYHPKVGCHCVDIIWGWYIGNWHQMNQSDLQIWCTPGNKNVRRVPTNILLPNRCHKFYLIWCDISKSHCEEDPSNYAGLEKRNNCRRWKRFFVQLIKKKFTWLCRYGYFLFCILCLTYQRSAKS